MGNQLTYVSEDSGHLEKYIDVTGRLVLAGATLGYVAQVIEDENQASIEPFVWGFRSMGCLRHQIEIMKLLCMHGSDSPDYTCTVLLRRCEELTKPVLRSKSSNHTN